MSVFLEVPEQPWSFARAHSPEWWAEYTEDPIRNADARDRLVTDNEDDLRATIAVVDWLERATLASR